MAQSLSDLERQILETAGKTYVPQTGLNAIGRPLFDTAQAELNQLSQERQRQLQAVMARRGLIGSGIELANLQQLGRSAAEQEQQALRDAIFRQNAIGQEEFGRSQGERMKGLLALLEGQRQNQLAEAERGARERFLNLQMGLQQQAQERERAYQEGLMKQQAQSLAALLKARADEQRGASQAAAYQSAFSQLSSPFGSLGAIDFSAKPPWVATEERAREQANNQKILQSFFGLSGEIAPHSISTPSPTTSATYQFNQPPAFLPPVSTLGQIIGPAINQVAPSPIVNAPRSIPMPQAQPAPIGTPFLLSVPKPDQYFGPAPAGVISPIAPKMPSNMSPFEFSPFGPPKITTNRESTNAPWYYSQFNPPSIASGKSPYYYSQFNPPSIASGKSPYYYSQFNPPSIASGKPSWYGA